MSVLQVPVNCGGITTTGSGAQVPAGGVVTVTASEISDIMYAKSVGHPHVVSSAANGDVVVDLGTSTITSITMNGNVYAVTAGVTAAMVAVDATQLLYEKFKLVTG